MPNERAQRKLTTRNNESSNREKRVPLFFSLFIVSACALSCVKMAEAQQQEEVVEEQAQPRERSGLGGIQRGQYRTEYADGVFNVRTSGKRGRELQINTHLMRSSADTEFWKDVQCRENLFVGKDGKKVEVGERLETIFAQVESLTNQTNKVVKENTGIRADYSELQMELSLIHI